MTSFIKKAGLGVAMAATALSVAAPAEAQRWRGRHYDRGGDAAAGALIGGIVGLGIGAAIASNDNRRGGYYDDRGYYDRGYDPQPYYNDYRPYRQRCWTERRYDPYYGRPLRVRVCG